MTDQSEPSVLEYFLAKIQFWKTNEKSFSEYLEDEPDLLTVRPLKKVDPKPFSEISDLIDETMFEEKQQEPISPATTTEAVETDNTEEVQSGEPEHSQSEKPSEAYLRKMFPWKLFTAIVLAIAAQWMYESSKKNLTFTLIFYGIAALLIIISYWQKEFSFSLPASSTEISLSKKVREVPMLASVPLLIAAFITFNTNRFNFLNILLWLSGIWCLVRGLWIPRQQRSVRKFGEKIGQFFRNGKMIKISSWEILMILVALMAVFFRTYLLDTVPGEMFSDQAEKLLDVQDVLDGQYSTFFPRNTGREAFQMYLTAAVVKIFGTGISFLSLKIGTALCGLLMIPYVYLLGKEIGNKWVGFFAVFFISIAYWPNVIARVGLRYILYAAFTAPTLYYFIRGLRQMRRNDFILSGIFLGIGLHGYSSFRFLPVVIGVGVVIYWIHHLNIPEKRKNAIWALLIIGVVSFAIFLPLFRYWLSNPEMFSYRVATRLGTTESEYPGNPIDIFFSNFFKASVMFFDDNGNVWVHSIPGRPALDAITAAFYFIGILLIIFRYFKNKNWVDLFLLVSIPLLLMPSILSLAFPAENPCLNRTSAAMVPVFLIAGMGMDTMMRGIKKRLAGNGISITVVLITVVLLFLSANSNYDLVFHQYQNSFMQGAWNTSDMGTVVRGFADSVGTADSAYVIPYPYWVDTRLVGINAGYPRKDYALWADDLPLTLAVSDPKLFIFHPDDENAMQTLFELYPDGELKRHVDQYEGKDFYIFLTASNH